MPKSKLNIPELVASMPNADQPDRPSKFTGPHPKNAHAVFSTILAGGKDAVCAVIDMLVDPTKEGFIDYKARYVLNGMAVYAAGKGDDTDRRMYSQAVCSRIGGTPPKQVQKFLLRQLQVAGGKEAVETLTSQLPDPDLCEPACQALAAIGSDAGKALRKAFRGSKGALRLTIIQALGALRTAGAVGELAEALRDPDREIRITAAWALAQTGQPAAVGPLLKAADPSNRWEKVKITKACMVLAETLLKAGKKEQAQAIYRHLKNTRKAAEDAYVKEAATKALSEM